MKYGGGVLAVNEILAALADENRRKILQKLKEGKISSGDETKYKNYIYYELNLSVLDETIMWINELRGYKK